MTPSVRTTGYTLIELVIVIMIVGILAAFVAPILTATVSSYQTSADNVEILAKMRYATERMAREIHQMRKDVTNTANYDIGMMAATQLVFTRTDGIQISIDNATLATEIKLAYTSPAVTATLTDAVTSFSFTYCKIDGTTCATSTGATVDKSNVAFIQIDMTLAGSGTGTYTSTMRVDLRNAG